MRRWICAGGAQGNAREPMIRGRTDDTEGRRRLEGRDDSKPAYREALLLHIAGDLTPSVDLQFVENIMDVIFHRRHFDMQLRRNLLIAQPAFNQGHNLHLSFGQGARLAWAPPSHLAGKGRDPRKGKRRNSR